MALFEPFRALGHVVDEVPFAIQRRGKETFTTTSVGTAWQVFNTAKLSVCVIGPQLPGRITALAATGDLTLAGLEDGSVVECQRVHVSGTYVGHRGRVVDMAVLGSTLLTLGSDRTLRVWSIGKYGGPRAVLRLDPGFTPTRLAHPATYLNKVVLGSVEGRLQLWNFSTGSMLYEFEKLGAGVRALEPSPALDVVGIGLDDGRVVLLNLRDGDVIAEFANAAGAGCAAESLLTGSVAAANALAGTAGALACTALAFRTGAGAPVLAAGGAGGAVTLWDLERRRLAGMLPEAHDGGVTRLHFFAGEPRLQSAGADNAMKQWVLDGAAGTSSVPRLLRFRAGHAAAPAVVRHYGAGKSLLSAGSDRTLRLFSTVRDDASRELGQGHVAARAGRARAPVAELRLPRVVALAAADARERDWANVLTAHVGDGRAYTWRLAHAALGAHVLEPPRRRGADADAGLAAAAQKGQAPNLAPGVALPPVSAVALTACGNFALVGSVAGRVDRYNMQSGLHRGNYNRAGTSENTEGKPAPRQPAHDGAVVGLCSDGANRWMASAGADGVLRTWNFKRGTLTGELRLPAAAEKLAHHGPTGLVAVACADLGIYVYDIEAQRRVRHFKGHLDRISDIQFSADCRWLLSSSMDGVVRIWDIPAAQLLQVLDLGSAVASFSLSPSMDLLATVGPDSRGIDLWANQLIYGEGGDAARSARPMRLRAPRPATDDAGDEGGDKDRVAAAKMHRQMLALTHSAASDDSDEEEAGDAAIKPALSSSSSSSSDDDDDENGKTAARSASEGEDTSDSDDAAPHVVEAINLADEAAGAAYAARAPGGVPRPLVPAMLTLSLLPRSQWQVLAHLQTVKARNAPIQAPKKPEAAPFFLPSLPAATLGRDVAFSGTGKATEADDSESLEAAAAAAWRNDDEYVDTDVYEDANGAAAPPGKRQKPGGVQRNSAPADQESDPGSLAHLLMHGSPDGVLATLTALTPSQVEVEVRGLVSLADADGGGSAPPPALEALLRFVLAQTAAGVAFDFVQALLKLALEVHRDSVLRWEPLQALAKQIATALRVTWQRVDTSLSAARCVVGLLGDMQP